MAFKDGYTENSDVTIHVHNDSPATDVRVSVVKIKNLEEATERIVELNQTANLGIEATRKLKNIIESLSDCWIGSSASTHIHNLNAMHSFSSTMSSVALEISIQAYREMEIIQRKEEAAGGKTVSMKPLTITSFDESLLFSPDVIAAPGEVYVNPMVARDQLANLRTTRNLFFDFYDQYSKIHSYIMEIWESGGFRDYHEDTYQQWKEQIELMKNEYDAAISDLDKAIQIWEAN